ncbi:8453_t:CDS:1, partial [Racocetra fulgida]
TSAYLHRETKELQEKLSDYKKLEQYLSKARIALTQILNTQKNFQDFSYISNPFCPAPYYSYKLKDLLEQRKFLYKEENDKICEGAYEILNSMKEKNYLARFVDNRSLIELEKNIAEIQ